MTTTSASELLASLDALHNTLKAFSTALLTSPLPHWIPGSDCTLTLDDACQLYCDIWYRDGQDGRTTISQHGLIGADASLIHLAHAVNTAKTLFKQHATGYRLSEDCDLQQQLQHRSHELAALLNRQGVARLHLKQCYRHIPILDRCPDKIGFSWYSSGRSIRKLTPQQALEKLLKMDTSQPHIQRQLDAVGRLGAGELLAQLQTQVPVMRANMLWKQGSENMRQARNVSLPILIPLDTELPVLPEYNEPPLTPPAGRSRQARSDLKIDPQPFLPSLRAHRYLG